MAGGVIVNTGGKKDYPGNLTAFVFFTCVVAVTGGLIFGYDNGISGGVTSMDSFLSKFFPSVYRQEEGKSLFTSSLYLAPLLASFFALVVTRMFGRKWSMFGGGVTFLIGAALNGFAKNVLMLILGLILLGIVVGFANQSVPVYLSEMAPARLRGMLNIGFQLMITIGIFAGNLINYGTSKIKGGWGWRVSPAPAGIISLCAVLQLLDSLISSSYSIRFYPKKWQLIRVKFEQLRSGLTAMADGNDFNTNSELSKLLQAAALTANEAQVLAHRCSDESYNDGKLLVISDLDVITAKLELHIKQLTEIHASGILRHSQAIILSRPSVTTLLKICSDVDSSGELIGSACGILKSLSNVDEIKRLMLEEGAVSIFLRLLRSKEEVPQIQAIEFLAAIAREDDTIKEKVVRAGVVESLIKVLNPNSHYSSKARQVALRASVVFCFSSPTSINLLMASRFLPRVLFFLRNGDISIQESALEVVCRLCGLSEEAKKEMGDIGFIPELVKLFDARSFEVRELAAEAICGMVSIRRNRRRFIQDDQNVNRILQLLNLEEKTVTKKFLLPALMSLVKSNNGRKKIRASEYVKHLEKLAEADVADAKKIVKRISSNIFRSILTGIWSY